MAAASVNKVFLIGNLGKDPEVQTFDNDRAKVSFPLATHYSYKNKIGDLVQRTEWHNIILWIPSLVERAQKYLKKGNSVYIEGRIQTRNYEDPNSGEKRYVTEIIGNDLRFLDKRSYADNTYGSPPESTGNNQNSFSRSGNGANTNNTEVDDLPF